ncbi:MAG: hypothetical protein ACHQC8_00450 [Solirubrobacterales bacterium]
MKIGANAVIVAPRGGSLRIGRGARIGAGTVVTHDVPAGATVVAPAARVLTKEATTDETATNEATGNEATGRVTTVVESNEQLSEGERSL